MREELGKFDRIVMNPPFDHGSDIEHIRHAMKYLKPGGRLVAICANGPRQREAFTDESEHWEDLPANTFAGTGVSAALFVMVNSAQSSRPGRTESATSPGSGGGAID